MSVTDEGLRGQANGREEVLEEGRSFDELSRVLANGTLSRGRVLKLMSVSVLGSLVGLGALAGPAAAARRTRERTALASSSCTQDSQCKGGRRCCAGSCVNLKGDQNNCGECGNACPSEQTCENGVCKTSGVCPAAQTRCSGCVDFSSNPGNCGSCGNSCARGEVCCDGTCRRGQCCTDADCPSNAPDLPITCQSGTCVCPLQSRSPCFTGCRCPEGYTCQDLFGMGSTGCLPFCNAFNDSPGCTDFCVHVRQEQGVLWMKAARSLEVERKRWSSGSHVGFRESLLPEARSIGSPYPDGSGLRARLVPAALVSWRVK